jgi:dihydropyrimidinase
MELPFGGTFASDTFETGTRAAAWGGTTTIVDFAVQSVGRSLREGLDAWHAKAEGNCAIDYGFHMILADVNEGSLKEMEGLVGEGVTSFKMFMAYPGVFYSNDGQILRALQKGAETGGLILMHAENGIAIDVLIEQALARGETDPRYHGIVRHELLEAEATHRAIKLAQVANAPVYIVHLSATSALAEVAKARDEGYNAFAETCPQYLFLSTDDLARPDFEGAKYVCSTPLRPKEHQAALWRGLRTDDLSVVSTDHCPFCFKGQKELGLGDFSKIPNGLPSVEHRMDLLHTGVLEGHISRRRWVEIACATPARMFGLYPRKGTIAPGSDADIVIYDPNKKQVFSAATHHMAVDYSCYEGKEITGKVEKVLSRGRLVIDGDSYTGAAGHGQFLRRDTCGYLR